MKPKTSWISDSIGRDLVNGLKRAGKVLFWVGTFVITFWGIRLVATGHVYFGLFAIVLSALILLMNMDKVSKALPGIFAIATLNAFVMTASGHLLHDRSVQIPVWWGVVAVIVSFLACLLSLWISHRRLSLSDRVCVALSLAFVLVGFTAAHISLWGIALLILAIPWVRDLLKSKISGSPE